MFKISTTFLKYLLLQKSGIEKMSFWFNGDTVCDDRSLVSSFFAVIFNSR